MLSTISCDSVTSMPIKKWLFLSVDQAVDAIASDFAQYPPQVSLYSTLWPIVYGNSAYLIPASAGTTMWAKMRAVEQPVQVDLADLGQWIVRHLKQSDIPLESLARICRLVFQTPAVHHMDSGGEERAGVWINPAMDDFACLQCGHCCRTLEYQDGCRVSDYRRWRELGRDDILEWVGTTRKAGKLIACKIWMVPGTNRFADQCPWLQKLNDQNRYACAIYDLRPTICREYPGSRKHARMTGCRGV
jgi:Fe-S-cluster containining protein